MKKAWLFSALGLVLVVLVVAAFVFARGYGMWGYGMGPGGRGGYGGGYGGAYCPNCGAYQGPQGPQGGYGMGPGMMGQGYGGGYGMGPGSGGGRQGSGQSEECQKYFDESAGMRKELNNKRFEYLEALRNPKTKPEETTKFEKEIWELQQQIFSKAPTACR